MPTPRGLCIGYYSLSTHLLGQYKFFKWILHKILYILEHLNELMTICCYFIVEIAEVVNFLCNIQIYRKFLCEKYSKAQKICI